MKDNIKKAVDLAEQEIQEKEIKNLKNIIKDLLEEKKSLEEDKRGVEKKISVIKQTIDDFKSGRLDKIKELQEKDDIAQKLLKFQITIINQPVITQPWYWTYRVVPYNPIYSTNLTNSVTTAFAYCNGTAGGLAGYVPDSGLGLTGTNYATATTGTYTVAGSSINL